MENYYIEKLKEGDILDVPSLGFERVQTVVIFKDEINGSKPKLVPLHLLEYCEGKKSLLSKKAWFRTVDYLIGKSFSIL